MADVMGSLNASLAAKMKTKFDPNLEKTLKEWICGVLGEDCMGEQSLADALKDGSILCRVMNTLCPSAIKRVNKSSLPFKQMENISNYGSACERLGLTEHERFQTLDLFEAKDIVCVMNHLRVVKLLSEKHNGDLSSLLVKSKSPAAGSRSSISSPKSPLNVVKSAKRWSIGTASSLGASQSVTVTTNEVPTDVSSLHDDITTKEEFKYSAELVDGAKTWLREILDDETLFTKDSLANELHSGVLLCQLINTIQPGTIPKISTSSFAFAKIENIGHFLRACVNLGLPKTDLFDPPDLYEKKNMNLVVNNIHVLARHVEKLDGYLGPKIANTSQVRTLYSSALREKGLSEILGEDQEREMEADEREMTDWVNSQLIKRNPLLKIPHLTARGIKTGVTLVQLLEIITKVDTIGFYEPDPQILWHCMQNASLILRFIFQQTFVELETKAQEIVLGRVDSIISLLRFLRDKFDVDYLFLKVLNEGEETKLSLFGSTIIVADERNTAEKEKLESIEAEIAKIKAAISTDSQKIRRRGNTNRAGSLKRKGWSSSSNISKQASLSSIPTVPAKLKDKPIIIIQKPKEVETKVSQGVVSQEKKPLPADDSIDAGSINVTSPEPLKTPSHVEKVAVDVAELSDEESEEEEESESSYTSYISDSSENEECSKSEENEEVGSSTDGGGPPTKAKERKVENTTAQQEKRIKELREKRDQTKKELSKQKTEPTLSATERVAKAQHAVRTKVATELLQTEQNYIKSIEAVVLGLLKPVQSQNILKPEEFKVVFANLQEILDVQKDLLKIFEERIGKEWTDKTTVGDIFINKMNIFKKYGPYLMNYNISIVGTQSLKQSNLKFKQLVNKFQRIQMKTSRLSLESFLIMPVQRIPRYILLMNDIKKYTPTTHPDFDFLTSALGSLQSTLQSHNEGIDPKASQYAQKLMSVASSISNVETIPTELTLGALVRSGRVLLRDGRAKITRNKGKNHRRFCFLFNDILLICTESEEKDSEQPFTFMKGFAVKEVKFTQTSKGKMTLQTKDGTSYFIHFSQHSKEWNHAVKAAIKHTR